MTELATAREDKNHSGWPHSKSPGPLYRMPMSPEQTTAYAVPEMGAEHSNDSREYTDNRACWDEHGFRIQSTVPVVPARSKWRMLDDIKLAVTVECKKPVPLRNLSAYAWTNAYHKENLEGLFSVINLAYVENSRSWDDWGVTTYEFSGSFYPTHNDDYRLSFYVKLGNIVLWANKSEVDHILEILPPRDNNAYTKAPSFTLITKNIYIGNYLAARKAGELGFDVILRFCDKVPKKYKPKEGEVPQLFHTFNKDSGAGSEIPPDKLADTVEWIDGCKDTYQKILIADEYGLGRVGSAVTAFVFARNPHLTFEEAYRYVQRRREIYCHKYVSETLQQLFPRE